MKNLLLYTIAVTLLVAACQSETDQTRFEALPDSAQTISLLGDTLKTEVDSLPSALANRIDSLSALALEEDRLVDSYIWEARKTAYTGDYRTAVIQLSSAIIEFPEEPRLYRHRVTATLPCVNLTSPFRISIRQSHFSKEKKMSLNLTAYLMLKTFL